MMDENKIEVEEYLKKKYGHNIKTLKNAMILYNSNIPERYWFKEKESNTEHIEKVRAKLNLHEWIVISGDSQKKVRDFIIETLMECIKRKKKCYHQDFFTLSNIPKMGFKSPINILLDSVQANDTIGLSVLQPGSVLNEGMDNIISFLGGLISQTISKSAIIGIKEYEDAGDLVSAYGKIGEFILDEEIQILEL